MNGSPSELSDDSLIAMIQASQSTPTKIATAEVFDRLANFNEIFSHLESKPDVPALIYRDSTGAINWASIGNRLVVGRAPTGKGTDWSLLRMDDEEMSRQHFEIIREKDGLFSVSDCDSTNGLFIDGSKADTALLIGGTEIRAGRTTFFFTGI